MRTGPTAGIWLMKSAEALERSAFIEMAENYGQDVTGTTVVRTVDSWRRKPKTLAI